MTVSCEYWVTGSHRSAQSAAGFVLRMLCILPAAATAVRERNGLNQDSSDARASAGCAIGAPLLTLSPSSLCSHQKAPDDSSVSAAIVR